MAGDDKSLNAFGTASCPHLLRFKKFCGILSSLYGIDLDVPELTGDGLGKLSSFKSFLSGLIEGRKHPWRVPLRRLGIRSRMSIAHSLFLFRKTLPSKEPNLREFLDQISKEQPEPSSDFLDFCSREIAKLFPVGWDRSLYPNRCISSVVSTKSCAENGRSKGGCRSWVLDNKMPDISCREDFVLEALSKTSYARPRPSRLVAVETGGKWRKITVPSGNFSLLKPLHQSIYDRLSTQPWLLRGKESKGAFKGFSCSKGEVFVSGDYESATDFLNSAVSKHCLSTILMRCRSVPQGIQLMAMDSLSLPVELRSDDGVIRVDQKAGQMMGYLLSFPLLCLINYLTFRYAVPRDVPLKINGDDIVFRSTTEERDRWMRMVGESGLVLSVGKTMVSRRFFTLNSSLFEGRNDGPRMLPFIRSTALFPRSRDPESVMGLQGRYKSFCPGFCGTKRSILRTEWLRINRGLIDVTRRSVSRGLGLCVTFPELVESGLWAREAWHLSLPVEKPIPAPFSEWACRPKGYKYIRCERITEEMRRSAEGISAAWLQAAWERNVECSVDDWFTEMKEGTYDWGHWAWSRSSGALARARLLKLSVRNANRFLRPKRSLFNPDSFKSIKRSIWVSEEYQTELTLVRSSDSGVDGSITVLQRRFQGGEQAVDPLIDVRNYLEPSFRTGELIFGHEKSITSSDDVSVDVNGRCFELKGRDASACAVRVYARGGVGFAPPPCLL
jgi:hypothetical protein